MQNNTQAQRVNLGYFLAFGRPAKREELSYWTGRTESRNWDVKKFVDNHASWFASSQGFVEVEATIHRATEAAWSKNNIYRTASPGNVYARYSNQVGRSWRTYVDLVSLLTEEMDRNKSFKETVVRQSYADAALIPKSSDVNGWVNGFGSKKPYVQMVAEHLIWKAGREGKSISGMSRSPSGVIAEALRINNATLVAAGGGNLVAAGGGNLVAAGGGNLVAAGGGNLSVVFYGDSRLIVVAGGLAAVQQAKAIPLIGMDGSTLMGPGGLRLVGNDGASMAQLAGSLISNNPSSMMRL